MEDKDKSKRTRNSNVPRNTSSSGTPTPSRDLPSRSGISALLSGDSGPVQSLEDARSWLDKKGWVLAGEQYDRLKMVNILMTVSLLPKLPMDAAAAIRSVALLIDDDIKDSLSSDISTAVANKLLAHLGNIPDELSRTKEFLEATSTKQANTVVQLQETATQHAATTANLIEISSKLTSADIPRPPPQWPSIQSSGPSLSHDPSTTDSDIRLQQRLLLASRTVLVEVDRAHAPSSSERNPQTVLKLRDDLNAKLSDLDDGNFDLADSPGDRTKIRGIQTLERGAYLFELNSPAAAARFRSYCSEFNLLLTSLGRSAHAKDKGYNLVFRFVPCQSSFDPSDLDHISAIETENGLDEGSITSASWIKNPERRSPNQHVASLKVICSSPEAANHLLRERIYVAGHVVTVRKDLREPIRCNKCQLYGHIRSACISDEKCAFCASSEHTTADCRPNQRPCCISCGPDSKHASSSRTCPTFIEKCSALDKRYPENAMPYFPTGDRWTWARAPPQTLQLSSSTSASVTAPSSTRSPNLEPRTTLPRPFPTTSFTRQRLATSSHTLPPNYPPRHPFPLKFLT
jgi:hypothetical protein